MNDWSWEEIEREWSRDPDDRVRQAAWHLLSNLDERITNAYVGETRPSDLDGQCLLGQSWSERERIAATVAWEVYRGGDLVDLGRLVPVFSDEQFDQFREALGICRGDRPVAAGHG